MKQSKERPYVLFVAEIIYTKVVEIKKKNLQNFSRFFDENFKSLTRKMAELLD